ncbi:MAG TPA: isoprenylcysteine carboxylmethyltransferase family protein [Lapillicoccus sp.]|nr:isoprenylcysteine carboxylmethyltransferase family protein [Lapillicoccus sp.]
MTEPVPAQGADVHVPPPLVYAGTLAAAWAVGRLVPLRMPGGRWRQGVGWGLVVAGQALGAAGAATFRRHQTSVIPGRPATAMVTTGPYVYTRNPMYLGLSLAYAGGSLVLGTWWAAIALPGVVAYIDRNVIRREETYLRERFGDEYEQFSAHTRRWV